MHQNTDVHESQVKSAMHIHVLRLDYQTNDNTERLLVLIIPVIGKLYTKP